LQGEQSSRRQVFAGGAKELGSVEPVQLRSLRVGQIENDHVKLIARGFEIEAAVDVMDVDARIVTGAVCTRTIGSKRSRLRGEEPPRHIDEHGIELHIVDALDRRMLQDLNNTAVRAATDEQNFFRRRMLQQRVMDRFFGGSLVGHTGQDHTVVVDAANTARLDDGQVAIDRVTGFQ
jgi:DNA-binding protein